MSVEDYSTLSSQQELFDNCRLMLRGLLSGLKMCCAPQSPAQSCCRCNVLAEVLLAHMDSHCHQPAPHGANQCGSHHAPLDSFEPASHQHPPSPPPADALALLPVRVKLEEWTDEMDHPAFGAAPAGLSAHRPGVCAQRPSADTAQQLAWSPGRPAGGGCTPQRAAPRMHACRFCSYQARTRSALVSHERTHTGERPFCCPLCPAAFNLRSTLNHHLLTHDPTRRFPCATCGKVFSLPKSLGNHRRKAHPSKAAGFAAPHALDSDARLTPNASLMSNLRHTSPAVV